LNYNSIGARCQFRFLCTSAAAKVNFYRNIDWGLRGQERETRSRLTNHWAAKIKPWLSK